MAFYRERYVPIGLFENAVYDGVPEALEALRALGIACSSRPRRTKHDARRILEHFELASHFAGIHGAQNDGGRADKSELLAYLLEHEGLDAGRDRIAMIGDRKFDAIGARNVGIAAIGALWGYGGREELRGGRRRPARRDAEAGAGCGCGGVRAGSIGARASVRRGERARRGHEIYARFRRCIYPPACRNSETATCWAAPRRSTRNMPPRATPVLRYTSAISGK